MTDFVAVGITNEHSAKEERLELIRLKVKNIGVLVNSHDEDKLSVYTLPTQR